MGATDHWLPATAYCTSVILAAMTAAISSAVLVPDQSLRNSARATARTSSIREIR